jgi:hypothetical protein
MLETCPTPNARLLSRQLDGLESHSLDAILRQGLVELLTLEEAILERTRFSLAHEFGHLYFYGKFDQEQRYLASSVLVAREILGPPHADLRLDYQLSELESGELLSTQAMQWPVERLPELISDRWRLELKCDEPHLQLRFQFLGESSS